MLQAAAEVYTLEVYPLYGSRTLSNCLCRYDDMPRVIRAPTTYSSNRAQGTLGQYFATMHCPVCHQLTVEGVVCAQCRTDSQKVAIVVGVRVLGAEKIHCDLLNVGWSFIYDYTIAMQPNFALTKPLV